MSDPGQMPVFQPASIDLTPLLQKVADLEAQIATLTQSSYPYMCCDGHQQIGHLDSSSELCPLCRANNEIAALTARAEQAEQKGTQCFARRSTDPPQDCDWPFCGCDPRATEVLVALQECGMLKLRGAPVERGADAAARRLGRLRELVAEWRKDADELDDATQGQWVEPGVRRACADELAALLAAPVEK